MKKIIYIAFAVLCAACTPNPLDESKLFLTEDQANELVAQVRYLLCKSLKTPI